MEQNGVEWNGMEYKRRMKVVVGYALASWFRSAQRLWDSYWPMAHLLRLTLPTQVHHLKPVDPTVLVVVTRTTACRMPKPQGHYDSFGIGVFDNGGVMVRAAAVRSSVAGLKAIPGVKKKPLPPTLQLMSALAWSVCAAVLPT